MAVNDTLLDVDAELVEVAKLFAAADVQANNGHVGVVRDALVFADDVDVADPVFRLACCRAYRVIDERLGNAGVGVDVVLI